MSNDPLGHPRSNRKSRQLQTGGHHSSAPSIGRYDKLGIRGFNAVSNHASMSTHHGFSGGTCVLNARCAQETG